MTTGWLWEERYAWHDAGIWNDSAATPPNAYAQPERAFENPETKRRFRNLLDVTGVLDQLVQLRARPATDEEILRVHTPAHLAHIRAVAASGGDAGDGAAMGRFGDEIAAARGRRRDRRRRRGARRRRSTTPTRSCARPATTPSPGARWASASSPTSASRSATPRQVRGVGRVAVVDWDVHHGNGTETVFLADPSVLSISLHQDELYPPGRGRVDVVGEGAGRGANLNIPLPPGAGIAAYGHAFERVVVPALRAFQPELIIVASGFDASAYDPLGRMDLDAEDYRALTATLMDVAAEVCDGRLLMSHEGGYSSFYVPYCGLAVIEQMTGHRSDTDFAAVAPDGHRVGPRKLEAARARRRRARGRERRARSGALGAGDAGHELAAERPDLLDVVGEHRRLEADRRVAARAAPGSPPRPGRDRRRSSRRRTCRGCRRSSRASAMSRPAAAIAARSCASSSGVGEPKGWKPWP